MTPQEMQYYKRENLRLAMNQNGFDEGKLAKASGLDITMIYHLLSGRRTITEATCSLLGKAMRIHPGFIHNIPISQINSNSQTLNP